MGPAAVERRDEEGVVILHPAEELDRSHIELLWIEANPPRSRAP